MTSQKKVIPTGSLKTKTMAGHAEKNFKETDKKSTLIGVDGPKLIGVESIKHAVGDDQLQENIKQYNAMLDAWSKDPQQIDEIYRTLTPVRGIIVRVKHIEMIMENGLYRAPEVKVYSRSKSGHYMLEPQTSKYQTQIVGIVIAVNPSFSSTFTPGDIVQVDRSVIASVKHTELHPEEVGNGFTHYSYMDDHNPPTSCTNRHFGYFILKDPMSQVNVIVEKYVDEKENTENTAKHTEA